MKRSTVITLLLQFIVIPAISKVVPSSLISDNMVLQQQTKVRLWGKATPDTKVSISASWGKKSYSCVSDANGCWLAEVVTPQAGNVPYSITFDDGEKTVISHILIGEVWFAGGQSNMEMPLKGFANCPVKGSLEAIAEADNHPQIRMFNIPRTLDYEPQSDTKGQWKVASSETAPQFSAAAYFFALTLNRSLHVPVGIINCSVGGSKVESWTNREVLQSYPDIDLSRKKMEETPDYLRPMVFYNAMVHPVINYTIKGFIWYQGESNVGNRDYALRMANMVKQWREEWKLGEIPFYYVELAPYFYNGGQKEKGPILREEQYKAQALIPNSGMICTNDLVERYEANNVHPRNKELVGKRLGYIALNRTYDKKGIPCNGPEYKAMEIAGSRVKLTFHHAEMGYTRNQDIQGFEVAGSDRVFYPADKVEPDHSSQGWWVSSGKVAQPVAVRYCFKDYQPGNLGGKGELPMVPFRTDDW